MASALSKPHDYKYMADKYSQLNKMQVEYGKKLVKVLEPKHGDKVLDMGCGTGEITSFIADQVGEEGQVIGVDPDEERIKVATQKHCGAKKNIKFIVGDSSSHFPHYNERYYDVHFSNYVLHWLTAQEKQIFLKTAFNCLKPGGRIATQNAKDIPEILKLVVRLLPDEETENNKPPFHLTEKSVAESMLLNSGFEIVSSEFVEQNIMFPSLDNFLVWFCASAYVDEGKIVPHKKEEFAKKFVKEDGTVPVDKTIYRIIAKKSN